MTLSAEQAAAAEWYAAGATPIPIRLDGSKAPVGNWRHLTDGRPGPEVLHAFDGREGLAIVCGAASGHLEMVEFEGTATADGVWAECEERMRAAGLWPVWQRIVAGYHEQSPKGGVHLFYRLDGVRAPGNLKLAERPARPGELTAGERERQVSGLTPKRTLIETRGQGGYVIVAPTRAAASDPAGPAGQQPWTLSWGSPATIAVLTGDERAAVHRVLRSFHIDPPARPAPTSPSSSTTSRAAGGEERPGDRYAAEHSWGDILTPYGWTWLYRHGDKDHWRRPGKEGRAVSATTTEGPGDPGGLWVFSTSSAFEPETLYTKFGAVAHLEHGGDHSRAAQALAPPREVDEMRLGPYVTPAMRQALEAPAGAACPPGAAGRPLFTVPDGLNPTVAAALALLGARMRTSAQLDDIPLPRYIVDGWVKYDEIAQIIGASGSMKSFVAIDLAAHIATGRAWHGATVRRQNVMFVAAEGGSGIRKRVRAWEKYHSTEMHRQRVDGLYVIDEPVQIAARMGNQLVMSPSWLALVELVVQTRTGVLFVDTQARSTVGVKENDNTEMGAVFDYVDAMRRLVRARGTELTIVLVHHTGKTGSDGRGASAMYAAVNTELRVTKRKVAGRGIVVTVANSKNKDDDEATNVYLDAQTVALAPEELTADGSVRDGDEKTSSLAMVSSDWRPPREEQGDRPGVDVPTGVDDERARYAVGLASEMIGDTDEAATNSKIYRGIVAKWGVNERTAERALNAAIKAGWLSRTGRNSGKVTLSDHGRELAAEINNSVGST